MLAYDVQQGMNWDKPLGKDTAMDKLENHFCVAAQRAGISRMSQTGDGATTNRKATEMSIYQLTPNEILRGFIFPEPVQVKNLASPRREGREP